LVVVPSRSESFGLVAVEAQASGVSVLAAAVGGLRTVVGAGSGGILVDGWDPPRWSEETMRVLGDSDLRMALEAAGPRWAERFTWEAAVADLTAVYRSLS
jgi:D-inositol-3-phosphate glycosyltransferase